MLRNLLKDNIAYISFTKVDGTDRTIKATLREDLLPAPTKTNNTRKVNPDIVSVWDLEQEGWRSFRYDNVNEVTIV